jgi:hypothetical protein
MMVQLFMVGRYNLLKEPSRESWNPLYLILQAGHAELSVQEERTRESTPLGK